MEATTSALVQLLAHLADGPVTRAQLVGRRCEGGMPAYCCWRPALVDCCCSDCSYACQRCRVAGAVRRLGLAGQLAPGTSMQQLEAPLAVLGRYGLQVLNLLGNELHGSLPAALPAILPEVQVLDVGDNGGSHCWQAHQQQREMQQQRLQHTHCTRLTRRQGECRCGEGRNPYSLLAYITAAAAPDVRRLQCSADGHNTCQPGAADAPE